MHTLNKKIKKKFNEKMKKKKSSLLLFLWLFFDIYFEWCFYLICRLSISTIRNKFSNEKYTKSWVSIKFRQFRLNIVAIRIDSLMKKWKNHESLSNALYMSFFQIFYVICRLRVFDSKISFVLSIRIELSDEKFC